MLTETEEKFFTDRLEKMSPDRTCNVLKEEIIEPEIVDAAPIPSASSSEQKNDSLILSFQQRFHDHRQGHRLGRTATPRILLPGWIT